jgi:sigma-B regulation protein RsbU (phosphoserine phosphatase)
MQKAIKEYIENLRDATMQQQKIDSELDIARSIQRSMLPKSLPKNESITLCAMLKPARAVGGDFYDFFYIDEEHLCFLIADVSGKGVPAAMFMSVARSYLRAYSTVGLSASEIVEKLNNTIASNNDANMFVTLFFGILNVKSGELNYANAGHDEPYLLSDDGEYKRLEGVGNSVVGAFEDLVFRDETIFLAKNSKLFLYTDGVTEAFSKDEEQFSDKRVIEALSASREKSVSATMQYMENSITNFTKDCEQSDDITMLLLEFKMS